MRFYLLYAAAWIRGLFYRWPRQAPIPRGYRGVSCGLPMLADVRRMFPLGWEPWCFQRTRGHGTARLFRVELIPDEEAYERAVEASYVEMAERHEALQAHEDDDFDPRDVGFINEEPYFF